MKNRNKTGSFDKARRVPFKELEGAKGGDLQAMRKILNFYKPYMMTLCQIDLYDASGKHYYFVDHELYHELEIKLMTVLLLDFQLK